MSIVLPPFITESFPSSIITQSFIEPMLCLPDFSFIFSWACTEIPIKEIKKRMNNFFIQQIILIVNNRNEKKFNKGAEELLLSYDNFKCLHESNVSAIDEVLFFYHSWVFPV